MAPTTREAETNRPLHESEVNSVLLTGLVVGFVLGLAMAGLVVFAVMSTELSSIKKQAIDRGFAEYKTNSSGVTKFVWNMERTDSVVAGE